MKLKLNMKGMKMMNKKYNEVIPYTEDLIDDEWIEFEINEQKEFIKQLEKTIMLERRE